MSKARKAKWNIEENTREGYTRYSIRKYSMGGSQRSGIIRIFLFNRN